MYSVGDMELEGEANTRYADQTITEFTRQERQNNPRGRVIGGDQGDLWFDSFEVNDGKTTILDVELKTSHDDLTDDEAQNIATEILSNAFDSVGFEAIY
mgnify:CR=1 FL=1